MSYIDSSRGFCLGRRREDVHNSRSGDRVWCICIRSLWLDLLGNDFILTKTGLSQNLYVGHDLCVIPKNMHQNTQTGTVHRLFPTISYHSIFVLGAISFILRRPHFLLHIASINQSIGDWVKNLLPAFCRILQNNNLRPNPFQHLYSIRSFLYRIL